MDIILLGITIVSLVVALVMSVAAWRLTRDEKRRSAARVAALSVAANEPSFNRPAGFAKTPAPPDALEPFPNEPAVRTVTRAPWTSPSTARPAATAPVASVRMPSEFSSPTELPLNQPAHRSLGEGGPSRIEAVRASELASTHASGFLGASEVQRDNGGRQKTLAFAAVMLFVVMAGGLVWMMSGPEGTSAAAVGPNSPLELVSLTHARQNDKLAVSGLVRNPVNGKRVEHLSAVVFLFDRMGTFVTSSRANVDFLNLGAGDESPFVVSLAAPATVSRYRVSFRTDDGIVPHIDRRQAETVGIQQSTVKSEVVRQQ